MNLQQTEYSAGQHLENLYENVFEEVYPQIKTQKTGVLSTVIHFLIRVGESENELAQAEEICRKFKLDRKTSLNDDLSISLDTHRSRISK